MKAMMSLDMNTPLLLRMGSKRTLMALRHLFGRRKTVGVSTNGVVHSGGARTPNDPDLAFVVLEELCTCDSAA